MTVAFGNAPPESSRTVPASVAVAICAPAGTGTIPIDTINNATAIGYKRDARIGDCSRKTIEGAGRFRVFSSLGQRNTMLARPPRPSFARHLDGRAGQAAEQVRGSAQFESGPRAGSDRLSPG